jgi:predicted membrane metal-binding protein
MSKAERAAAYTTALIVLVFVFVDMTYGQFGILMFVAALLTLVAASALIGLVFWVLVEVYKEYFK